MVPGFGEHRGREHDGEPRETDDVPDDARAVRAGSQRLLAVPVHIDRADRALVLLEDGQKRAAAAALPAGRQAPDTHLAVAAATKQPPAVLGDGDRGHAIVVTVFDDVQQTAGLRRKHSDLAVAPRRGHLRAVVREQHARAHDVSHGDPKQLLQRVHRPHAHVVSAGRREHLAVVAWERQVVHHGRMAREQSRLLERVRRDREQLAVHRAHQYDVL